MDLTKVKSIFVIAAIVCEAKAVSLAKRCAYVLKWRYIGKNAGIMPRIVLVIIGRKFMDAWIVAGAIALIFVSTTAGSALVFFTGDRPFGGRAASLFTGFASGIMVAASVWSLIMPAMESSEGKAYPAFLPAAVGVAAGGAFILVLDGIVAVARKEKSGAGMSASGKMLVAMTVHNVPEGLAVGLALGAAFPEGETALLSAFGLAVGIAVQNFPEGAAVSLPLKSAGMGQAKAFGLGVLSGAAEPLGAGLGLVLAFIVEPLQPWLLGLAAGAMIFVVAEELLPGSKSESHPHAGALGFLAGFIVMMILDVVL